MTNGHQPDPAFHRPIAILARRQPAWRWRPDTWREALDAWLWHHQRVAFVLAAALCAAGGYALGCCLMGSLR